MQVVHRIWAANELPTKRVAHVCVVFGPDTLEAGLHLLQALLLTLYLDLFSHLFPLQVRMVKEPPKPHDAKSQSLKTPKPGMEPIAATLSV